MNFKQWLLNETFELPFDTLKDIYEFYLDSYKKYLKAPRTKIEPKVFDLNLQNTRYNFLQPLNPKIKVIPQGSLGGYSGLYRNNSGIIELALSDFEHVTYNTIEHEVLHYLQELIRTHAETKPSRKKPMHGGLPKPTIVKRIMKEKGISVQGKKTYKRTKHEHRPIEFYTNLNSLIRGLQYYYVTLGIELEKGVINNRKFLNFNLQDVDQNLKIKDWVKDTENKKKFLKKLVDRDDYVVSDLKKIKSLDQELYQVYIREITKKFINNDDFLDHMLQIHHHVQQGQELKDLKKKEKAEKQIKARERLLKQATTKIGEEWTEADFAGRITIQSLDLSDYSNIEDNGYSNSEIAEEMFQEIGLKLNTDNDTVKFAITAKNLQKIFGKIKKLKEANQSKIGSIRLPANAIRCNLDYMAQELAKEIAKNLEYTSWQRNRTHRVPKAEDILNLFYPGTREDCSKNDDGQIKLDDDPNTL